MIDSLVRLVDDLDCDAIITYIQGCLLVLMKSDLPLAVRRAIVDRLGAGLGSGDESDRPVTIRIPLGRGAHLVDENQTNTLIEISGSFLGRSDRWQQLSRGTLKAASVPIRSGGTRPTARNDQSNLIDVPTQRDSSPKLRCR